MCSHCGESTGPHILLSSDKFLACHVIRDANCGVENILLNRGPKGKCLNTFMGTLDNPRVLYLPAWQVGQNSISVYSFLYKTHPFLHASMALYCRPIRLSMVVAFPSLVGMEFGVGKITLDSKCNSSFMHAFDTLYVRHTFMNINVLSSLDRLDPQ